jgi:hypothetical protein
MQGQDQAHSQAPLGEATERMSAPVCRIRQHLKLELVFSGLGRRLLAAGTTESRQPRLLVTSAWHMVRSMEEFEAVRCNVTADPVDFRPSNRWD